MQSSKVGVRAVATLVVTFALALLASCGSTWDAAVARANAEGKPLVIEFYADWCGPCKRFEANVLKDAEVRQRLQSVQFFRYDFDSQAGKHHANRLGVRSVPTFIAVDPEGFPMGGLQGAVSKERFLNFLAWSEAERERLASQ